MKNILTFILILACIQMAQSQQSAKKFLMIELFTNTECDICADESPGFFERIGQYENHLHQISYYPPVPSPQCELYLSNHEENEVRGGFYGIPTPPIIVWNGTESTTPGQATLSALEEHITETSNISIKIREELNINSKAHVTIKTVGEKPTGNLRLFVALAEKEFAYDAPNGETIHRNVFRKMLTSINGDMFIPASTGNEVQEEFPYIFEPEWGNPNQIYALAWIQDLDDKRILNSGTRFDVVSSNAPTLPKDAIFDISPNPSNGSFFLTLENLQLRTANASVYNTLGQLVSELKLQEQNSHQALDLNDLQTGTYILKIQTEAGSFSKKIVKLN